MKTTGLQHAIHTQDLGLDQPRQDAQSDRALLQEVLHVLVQEIAAPVVLDDGLAKRDVMTYVALRVRQHLGS